MDASLIQEAKALAKSPQHHQRWLERFEQALPLIEAAREQGLEPTVWLPEFWAYHQRAAHLNYRNIRRQGYQGPCGDELQDIVTIYDTVERRYAGFSNVLEQLRYGDEAPKHHLNKAAGRAYPAFAGTEPAFLYACLVHRVTGSGASFEAHDHGWRNTVVPEMAQLKTIPRMADFIKAHPGPSLTSIGNQPPPVARVSDLEGARNTIQHYLWRSGPALVERTMLSLRQAKRPMPIQEAVELVHEHNRRLGQPKRFNFVLTAWVMDIAEYQPKLVDPWSDVYHGANATRCVKSLFSNARNQAALDAATRLVSRLTSTYPMSVEDVFCDSIRYVKHYIPKGYPAHLQSTCTLHWQGA